MRLELLQEAEEGFLEEVTLEQRTPGGWHRMRFRQGNGATVQEWTTSRHTGRIGPSPHLVLARSALMAFPLAFLIVLGRGGPLFHAVHRETEAHITG